MLVVFAGCRDSKSSFIFCSTISKPPTTPRRLAAATNVRRASALRFTDLKVIHDLLDTFNPGS
jgi:hypothetical protein